MSFKVIIFCLVPFSIFAQEKLSKEVIIQNIISKYDKCLTYSEIGTQEAHIISEGGKGTQMNSPFSFYFQKDTLKFRFQVSENMMNTPISFKQDILGINQKGELIGRDLHSIKYIINFSPASLFLIPELKSINPFLTKPDSLEMKEVTHEGVLCYRFILSESKNIIKLPIDKDAPEIQKVIAETKRKLKEQGSQATEEDIEEAIAKAKEQLKEIKGIFEDTYFFWFRKSDLLLVGYELKAEMPRNEQINRISRLMPIINAPISDEVFR